MGQKRAKKQTLQNPQKPHSRARAHADIERTGSKEHLKKDFLAKYAELKTISSACAAVGISRWAVQDWRKKDKQFERDFSETDLGISELIETNAIKFAIDGVPQYATDLAGKLVLKNDKPILVGLKHDPKHVEFMAERRMPDRYGRANAGANDLQVAKWLAAKAVEAINTIIPACCPACKTDLRLKDKIAEHLLHLSTTFKVTA